MDTTAFTQTATERRVARLIVAVALFGLGLSVFGSVRGFGVGGVAASLSSLSTTGRFPQAPTMALDSLVPAIPIVMYHRVSNHTVHNDGGRVLPTLEFEEQLLYLRDAGFTTLHLAQVPAILAGNVVSPERPIVLTFDDGYDDNLYEAYPLLKRYRMKGSFFIIAEAVGAIGHMKWEHLRRIDPRIIEIGSHTMTHRGLAGCPRRALERELSDSKLWIAFNLGKPVDVFAFPYGSYDAAAVEAVRGAGYVAAVTSDTGLNDTTVPLHRLRRIAVPRGMTLHRFARLVGGPDPEAPRVD